MKKEEIEKLVENLKIQLLRQEHEMMLQEDEV